MIALFLSLEVIHGKIMGVYCKDNQEYVRYSSGHLEALHGTSLDEIYKLRNR